MKPVKVKLVKDLHREWRNERRVAKIYTAEEADQKAMNNLRMKVNGEITNELMTWLKRKNLIIKVQVLIETDNIEKKINELNMWEESEHRELFTAICIMLVICKTNDKTLHLKSIMFHVLNLMNTIDPMNVHGHVEYLLKELNEIRSINIDMNNVLYQLAMTLMSPWRDSTPGMPMGVCLLWAIVYNILNLDITMHRYREFDEVANALGPQPCFDVNQLNEEEIGDIRVLLESIFQLLEYCMLNKNLYLKRFGYPDHFFQMRYHDIETMESWCENFALQIDGNSPAEIYIQDMSVNVLTSLQHVKMKPIEEQDEEQEQQQQQQQQQQQEQEQPQEENWPKCFLTTIDTYSDLDD